MKRWDRLQILAWGLLLAAVFVMPSAWACWKTTSAPAPAPQGPDLARMRQGVVLVSECPKTPEAPMRSVMARMVINRPVDAVWTALMNQESLFRNEPHMKKVATVAKTLHGRQDVAYSLSISSLLPTFDYVTRIQFVPEAWTAHFNRTSGSFKSFRGFATLSPVDNGQKTLMTYALQVDPGFLIPQFVVRSILKSELPSLMGHIRSQVPPPAKSPH